MLKIVETSLLEVRVGDQERNVITFDRFSPQNDEMLCSLSEETREFPTKQFPWLGSMLGLLVVPEQQI